MRISTVLVVTISAMYLSAPVVLAQDESALKARMDTLMRASAAGGIDRIEIFRLPKGYENIKQVQPEDLESLLHYRMTIREVLPLKQDLIARALATAKDRTWDLRWGIVFYWPKDRRIAALYFDETGRYGSLDKTPVSFAKDFFRQLKNALCADSIS